MRSQARIRRVDSGFRSKAEKLARRSRVARTLLAAVLAAAIAGCARNTPTNAAARYLANLRQHRYAACYAMLTDMDRHSRTLAEFLTEIPMGPDADPVWFGQILDVTNFQIGVEQRNGNIASVTVKVTTPDLPLWERTLDAQAGLGGSGAELAAASLKSGKFPTITYNDLIYLFKEHRRWRVVAAFTRRDHLIDQHREAAAAYREYEFTNAIKRYKSIIEQLRGLQATGAIGLAYRYEAELDHIQSAQASVPQSRKYAARYLHLSDVAMRMSEERVPAVFGSIRNRGARAIDNVQIAVTWYSGRGKDARPVFTERHPIIVTPLEFTDFSRPVIPLLPDEKRPFGFILTTPVQIQQDAAPYVMIGSIVFTQSSAPLPKPPHGHPAAAKPSAPGASGGAPAAAKPFAAPRPSTP